MKNRFWKVLIMGLFWGLLMSLPFEGFWQSFVIFYIGICLVFLSEYNKKVRERFDREEDFCGELLKKMREND